MVTTAATPIRNKLERGVILSYNLAVVWYMSRLMKRGWERGAALERARVLAARYRNMIEKNGG